MSGRDLSGRAPGSRRDHPGPARGSSRDPRAVLLACGFVLLALLLIARALAGPEEAAPLDVDERLETAVATEMRVRLTRLDGSDLELRSPAGFRLLGEDGAVLQHDEATLTVRCDDGKVTAAGLLGRWLEISACDDRPLRLGERVLPGRLRVHADERLGSVAVLILPLERYVAGVLPSEMPLSWPEAALRAQAIAARSYAVAIASRRGSARWDLLDSEASQVFDADEANLLRSRDLVASTAGLLLTYAGRPFASYYSSVCGGATRGNDVAFGEEPLPPLQGVDCDHCSWSGDHAWTVAFDPAAIATAFDRPQPLRDAWVEATDAAADGRVMLRDAEGRPLRVTAVELRRLLGHRVVRSTRLTGMSVATPARLSGRGFGHRVGLCQSGARALAEAGWDARAILDHYYPGAHLARASGAGDP